MQTKNHFDSYTGGKPRTQDRFDNKKYVRTYTIYIYRHTQYICEYKNANLFYTMLSVQLGWGSRVERCVQTILTLHLPKSDDEPL